MRMTGRPNFSSFLYQAIKKLTIQEMYAVSDMNHVLTSRYFMAASDPQVIVINQQQSALLIKLSAMYCLSQRM